MGDYGTFLGLSGRKDWNVVRADRQNALLYQKQMNADLQERIQREAQSRQGVYEYMAQLNQASVLDGDLERVKAVEAEQRKKIVEGLKKAGGDYNKFLLGEGSGILNNYYQNVMQSKEMQNAINNKLSFAQASLDTYMGRRQRPTEVILKDGTKKQVTFEEQLQMFDNGDIEELQYNGSVVPTDLVKIQQAIQQTFGKDPYKRKSATREDIYEYATRFGAEDWEANQLADSYEAGQIDGAETPIYFNYKERPQNTGASYAKKMVGRYGATDLDLLSSALNGAFQDNVIIRSTYNTADKKGKILETETDIASVPELMNSIVNMAGVKKQTDNKGNETYFYKGTGYGAKSQTRIDLSGADLDFSDAKLSTISKTTDEGQIEPVEFAGQQYYPNSMSNGIPLVKVKARFDSKGDAIRAGALSNTVGAEEGNFKKEDGDYIGYVFLPIDDSVKARIFNRPKAEAQTEYEDIYKYESGQFPMWLEEQGINVNEFFAE